MAKTIFNMADKILTPCNVARSRHYFVRWLQPAMWHVAMWSWQWIHQVATPCNVIRSSGMTCHWIRPNVHHNGIILLISISTISPQSSSHSVPVCEILSKSDHPLSPSSIIWYQRKLGSKQAYRVVHQPVSRGFAVFADACLAVELACGDQRRLTGNGSALEVVLHDYALYKSTFTLLYFTYTLGRKNDVMSIFKMADLRHLRF